MKLSVKEIALFGMLGALMFASKIALEFLPNVHLLGVFTIAMTVVFRRKALYPVYVFVFLLGLFYGFPVWWIPHLYLWTVLWAAAMLLPKNIPDKWKPIVYMSLCAVHGFLYGTLYAPSQALFFGLDFRGTVAWIMAGLPWDAVHGVSNFFCGVLICPLIIALRRSMKPERE